MEIKKGEEEVPKPLRATLGILKRGLFSRRIRFITLALVIALFFLIGSLSGFLISGFFGSLDSPSQRAITLLHFLGFDNLRAIKKNIKSILAENVKIPINYILGQFSNPEKIYIDIAFKDYEQIADKRQEALERGVIISSGEDFVPAKITYDNQQYDAKIRLKGHWLDHLEGDKWSFRIELKNDSTILGMKTFSLQDPNRREGVNEFFYVSALKEEDVLSVRYKFVEVIINGEKKGIYALEEYFGKELIEYNKRREGLILKFEDNLAWMEIVRDIDNFVFTREKDNEWFYQSTILPEENKVLEDPLLAEEFERARNMLESFREGELETHEVFDIDKLAKYFAVATVLGGHHSASWGNLRYYYNPVTSLLEPIGYDAGIGATDYVGIKDYSPSCIIMETNDCSLTSNDYFELFFRDEIFFRRYVEELERVSEKSYLDELFSKVEGDIKSNLKIIHKEKPYKHFFKNSFYENQAVLKKALSPIRGVNAYFQNYDAEKGSVTLSIGNIHNMPIEIKEVVFNDTLAFEPSQKIILQRKLDSGKVSYGEAEFLIPNGFVWRTEYAQYLKVNYGVLGASNFISEEVIPLERAESGFSNRSGAIRNPNIEEFDFIEVIPEEKIISIKKGSWELNKSLIIPQGFMVIATGGTSFDLREGASIISYSPFQMIGDKNNKIVFNSADSSGQGIAVLSANKSSYLTNVIFDNLANPSQNGWELTGAVTFYESPVVFDDVVFSNTRAEDALNIIRSSFSIKESLFENTFSDCLDSDFAEGEVIRSDFNNCGGDALDFSGSAVEINNVKAINPGDKGISAGEKSVIDVIDMKVEGGYICVASKDNSEVSIDDFRGIGCEYGIAVYQKKPEFGPSFALAGKAKINASLSNYLIEEGSSVFAENNLIKGKEKNVYLMLYEGGEE